MLAEICQISALLYVTDKSSFRFPAKNPTTLLLFPLPVLVPNLKLSNIAELSKSYIPIVALADLDISRKAFTSFALLPLKLLFLLFFSCSCFFFAWYIFFLSYFCLYVSQLTNFLKFPFQILQYSLSLYQKLFLILFLIKLQHFLQFSFQLLNILGYSHTTLLQWSCQHCLLLLLTVLQNLPVTFAARRPGSSSQLLFFLVSLGSFLSNFLLSLTFYSVQYGFSLWPLQ